MRICMNTGTTGLTPCYTIYDASGDEVQARTSVGVAEIPAGSGIYGVSVPDAMLPGCMVVWDTGEANVAERRYAVESFDLSAAYSLNKMIVTDGEIRIRNHADTADIVVQTLAESAGVRTRGATS